MRDRAQSVEAPRLRAALMIFRPSSATAPLPQPGLLSSSDAQDGGSYQGDNDSPAEPVATVTTQFPTTAFGLGALLIDAANAPPKPVERTGRNVVRRC